MAAVEENPTAAEAEEQIRLSRPRNQPISPSNPTPQISPLNQSTRCKPTISSLFLSAFTTNNNNNSSNMGSNVFPSLKNKTKNFTSATFRGLGCAKSSQVLAPEAIRSSADWEAKKVRKKKQRSSNRKKNHQTMTTTNNPSPVVVVVPDVWCAPGIALSSDATSVDCVVSRRPVPGRGRVDGERMNHRERSCTLTRTVDLEHISVLDFPSAFEATHSRPDIFSSRHHRHFRHRSPGGVAEIMVFQSSLMLGERSDGYDRYRDWRLNVDNMSYEELLELGDRIGYVSTGLREDEIFSCVRKTKHSILGHLPSHFPTETERKCSICQEEYETDDEVGKLDCGHSYHICCIKQWLLRKNACPVCKAAAAAQY